MNNKVLHNGDSLYRPAIVANIKVEASRTAQGTRPTSWVHPANYRKLLDVRWLVASNCAVMPLPHFIVKWAKVEWASREDADLNHKQLGSMLLPILRQTPTTRPQATNANIFLITMFPSQSVNATYLVDNLETQTPGIRLSGVKVSVCCCRLLAHIQTNRRRRAPARFLVGDTISCNRLGTTW
jgi:hypothetical protein